MYPSVPSLTIAPGTPRIMFLKGPIPHPQGTKKMRNPKPLGPKNRAKTSPPGQLFSKLQQKENKTRDRNYEKQS